MATGSTSRMLLPEAFTGLNDLESYVTHFELLAELKNGEELKEIRLAKLMNGRITLNLGYKNRPKSSILLYRKLHEKIIMNALKLFREHYSEKPVVFRGRLARRVQQPGEKLTDFLGD